jgi:hypothetical protein
MADETGRAVNKAARLAVRYNIGLGESLGRHIAYSNLKFKRNSVLYNAYMRKIPVSVFTSIGTEIIYQHPECSPAELGQSSYTDFKLFTDSLSRLEDGVVINLGSAVILPEVFLQSFSIARNLGHKIKKFTAANLDMIDHYRPKVNVVQRPTSLGGKGYTIIEKHEKSIPTLYYFLKDGKHK